VLYITSIALPGIKKKPFERADFDFLIFLQKKSKNQNQLSQPPPASQAEGLKAKTTSFFYLFKIIWWFQNSFCTFVRSTEERVRKKFFFDFFSKNQKKQTHFSPKGI
jgi:hypothetical protein